MFVCFSFTPELCIDNFPLLGLNSYTSDITVSKTVIIIEV